MTRKTAGLSAALLSALWLMGCGTINRPADGLIRLDAQTWRPTEDPRIRAGDAARIEALAGEIGERLWTLAILEAWLRIFIDGRGRRPVS
jgi:hypothetical protein